ncbi:MAG: flagellar basal-body rod protein FlgG [Roseibium album]|uniref:Flagellar basal-body rod protein FlgG n=2 Tax=cellular organisms TaxID=131567 RepID=A0AA36HJB6_9DINO|nr:flagellar basal-body rod protein FlgG [Roseibium album]MBG6143167.1 flagellar basal-body rod protein FlgG [Labrenzia sp. EL_142]MBG6157096.1 flagellar basal-body rod protein FlgG [Labrenzia sp. EL_162]MBG6166455.1 flagellar basal-body rod protein FlgG [Labrenzia sp. EL_195]MBG6172346.1 flagellar basal-body rod protein FlgG [Labrenzia sp. EL_132]MBG6194962.1 flagellar basal-body rod protein FlgG [Labrenzia sp. EL_159]MBG6203456.1 flagellar basal-body rod protein FlgG [Labrenzia sp. EL_13]M
MKALQIAATGMKAQERNVEVISNNVANMRTTGFKKQRADFQDLLYQNLRRMGTETSDAGTIVPTGVQIGSGVKIASTARIMSQGSLEQTGKELDVAIRGEGFFQIELPDGNTGYTRDGSFERDADGQLVTVDGYTVNPGITIPDGTQDITISNTGEVQGINQTGGTVTLGQIQLARFVNKSGLEAIGDNLFLETNASGTPQTGNPNDSGFGNVQQYFLEMANVDAVTEIADLISAQRAYEMNSRIIKAADEMYSTTANLR